MDELVGAKNRGRGRPLKEKRETNGLVGAKNSGRAGKSKEKRENE